MFPTHCWLLGKIGPPTVLTCFLATILGCGTSEYESRQEKRVAELRGGAPFRILFGPTQLADTPIKIRVPQVFKSSYTEDSAHPNDGPKIRPDRVQPPFFPLPGFKLCYEGTTTTIDGIVPYYCYLAAIPSRPGEAAKIAEELRVALKEKLKETPDAWEAFDANTPNGKALQWMKISVTADQPFYVLKTQQAESLTTKGTFELWLYDAQNFVVLVGWRVPSLASGPVAQIPGQAAPEPRLNLATMPALTAGSLEIAENAAAP